MTTERVHLAGDDEDDLYSGFDVNNELQVGWRSAIGRIIIMKVLFITSIKQNFD